MPLGCKLVISDLWLHVLLDSPVTLPDLLMHATKVGRNVGKLSKLPLHVRSLVHLDSVHEVVNSQHNSFMCGQPGQTLCMLAPLKFIQHPKVLNRQQVLSSTKGDLTHLRLGRSAWRKFMVCVAVDARSEDARPIRMSRFCWSLARLLPCCFGDLLSSASHTYHTSCKGRQWGW